MTKLPDVDEWARELGKKGEQYALELLEQEYGVSATRLRELAEADREGRCVVLPIKIPGWGWYCNSKFPNAISAYFDYSSQVVDCMEDYILRGTKEEAEAALAKLNSKT